MSALTKSLTGLGFGVAMAFAATSAQASGASGCGTFTNAEGVEAVSYTHLRAHET